MRIEHEVVVRTRDGEGRMIDTGISWFEISDSVIGALRLLEVVAEQNEKKMLAALLDWAGEAHKKVMREHDKTFKKLGEGE